MPELAKLPADWTEEGALKKIGQLLSQVEPQSRSIVYVDFLGLISVFGLDATQQYAATTEIGLALKRAAMQLQIPVVAGVQLNRNIELRKEKHPIPSDFRDSGRLEEIADVALGLYCPGYNNDKIPDEELQVFCLKTVTAADQLRPCLGRSMRPSTGNNEAITDGGCVIFTAPYSLISSCLDISRHLHPAHLADLRGSGLTDNTIRAAGIYSLAPPFLDQSFKTAVPTEIESALCFPYQDATFARIKLFPALGKMKYAQPPKTGARLYVPFQIASGAVYVCEGEKKTLAAYQAGLNALGIGGVWNWLQDGSPIGDLNLIQWDDCEVTIIPDSDVFQRPDLLRAIYALGCELRAQGANVYVAQIPQPSRSKIGLDDFLVAGDQTTELEVFTLGHRIFKRSSYWYDSWKFKKALAA